MVKLKVEKINQDGFKNTLNENSDEHLNSICINKCVALTNFPPNIEKEKLIIHLNNFLGMFGSVEKIIFEGSKIKKNTYIVIQFQQEETNNKLRISLKDCLFFDKLLKVNIDKTIEQIVPKVIYFNNSKEETNILCVKNIPNLLDDNNIHQIFSEHGRIVYLDVKRENTITAYIYYNNIDTAKNIMSLMNGGKIIDNVIEIVFSKSITSCLWVGNIDYQTLKVDKFIEAIKSYGKVNMLEFNIERRCLYVNYEEVSNAVKLTNEITHKLIQGLEKQNIMVDYCNPPAKDYIRPKNPKIKNKSNNEDTKVENNITNGNRKVNEKQKDTIEKKKQEDSINNNKNGKNNGTKSSNTKSTKKENNDTKKENTSLFDNKKETNNKNNKNDENENEDFVEYKGRRNESRRSKRYPTSHDLWSSTTTTTPLSPSTNNDNNITKNKINVPVKQQKSENKIKITQMKYSSPSPSPPPETRQSQYAVKPLPRKRPINRLKYALGKRINTYKINAIYKKVDLNLILHYISGDINKLENIVNKQRVSKFDKRVELNSDFSVNLHGRIGIQGDTSWTVCIARVDDDDENAEKTQIDFDNIDIITEALKKKSKAIVSQFSSETFVALIPPGHLFSSLLEEIFVEETSEERIIKDMTQRSSCFLYIIFDEKSSIINT